jgi:hypothetical protein
MEEKVFPDFGTMYAARYLVPILSSWAIATACFTAGCLFQHGFNFAEFDPKAANLDLMVEAPEVFDIPIPAISSKISRAVHPGTSLR